MPTPAITTAGAGRGGACPRRGGRHDARRPGMGGGSTMPTKPNADDQVAPPVLGDANARAGPRPGVTVVLVAECEPFPLTSLVRDEDPEVFRSDRSLNGVRGRDKAGCGLPRLAPAARETPNAANHAAARAGMMACRGPPLPIWQPAPGHHAGACGGAAGAGKRGAHASRLPAWRRGRAQRTGGHGRASGLALAELTPSSSPMPSPTRGSTGSSSARRLCAAARSSTPPALASHNRLSNCQTDATAYDQQQRRRWRPWRGRGGRFARKPGRGAGRGALGSGPQRKDSPWTQPRRPRRTPITTA